MTWHDDDDNNEVPPFLHPHTRLNQGCTIHGAPIQPVAQNWMPIFFDIIKTLLTVYEKIGAEIVPIK